jgi:hypothetical protein
LLLILRLVRAQRVHAGRAGQRDAPWRISCGRKCAGRAAKPALWNGGRTRTGGPRNGGENERDGDGSKSFNTVGIFRQSNFQNSICAASSSFKFC